MEKLKIGIAVFFAALTFFVGMHIASENNSEIQDTNNQNSPV
jgi:hypothetical protein